MTGGIGSGKSLVCDVFLALNVPVYRADAEARRIMESHPGVREQLGDYFGPEVFIKGSLNRSWLASRIFTSESDRQFVNSIVHPAVQDDFNRWIKQQDIAGYVIEEAALLFESGAGRKLDRVILVSAPVKLRVERIMRRDGLKRGEISARMASQIKPEEAEKLADHIILNDEKSFLLPQVLEVHQKIRNGL